MYKAKLIVGNHCGVTWVLHCTIYTVYWCGIYIYSLHSSLYSVYSIPCSIFTVYSVQCVRRTMYVVHYYCTCTLYNVQCTCAVIMYDVHCTSYSERRALYNVQCTSFAVCSCLGILGIKSTKENIDILESCTLEVIQRRHNDRHNNVVVIITDHRQHRSRHNNIFNML